MGNYKHIDNPENLKRKLGNIIKEIQELEDPHVIIEYTKFFKKHVGFFRRNFVAAYIIKNFLNSNGIEKTRIQKKHSSSQDMSFHKKNNNTHSLPKSKRLVLKNISKDQCSSEELLTFLSSIDGVEKKDILFIALQDTKTLITINPQVLRNLTQGIRNNQFKNKKIYYSY